MIDYFLGWGDHEKSFLKASLMNRRLKNELECRHSLCSQLM